MEFVIVHESGSKDYQLIYQSHGCTISDLKMDEDECRQLYEALKKVLELENLI